MSPLINFVCYTLLLISVISGEKCPQLGVKGIKSFPNLLNITDGGYHAMVETIRFPEGKPNIVVIDDYFTEFTGILKLGSKVTYYYYPSTGEGYIISDYGGCFKKDLNVSNQQDIVRSWSTFDPPLAEKVTFGLGPVSLLVYFISQQDNLQLIANSNEILDENLSVNTSTHWFTCLPKPGHGVHVHLDSLDRVTKMVVTLPDSTNMTFNYIKLMSISANSSDPITYPYGYGCTRKLDPDRSVPRFAQSESFILSMQIGISNDTKGFASETDSINILRSNGIYSYENTNMRIISDPKTSIDYLINVKTGKCAIKRSNSTHFYYNERSLSLDSNIGLFMTPHILGLREDDLSYFGQIKLESKLCDIYERTTNLFNSDETGKRNVATITYFIPVESQAPLKIKVKFFMESTLVSDSGDTSDNYKHLYKKRLGNITQLNIDVFYYLESENLNYPDQFDLRNCEKDSGQSTWFQIVFSDVLKGNIPLNSRHMLFIEQYLRKALNFISMTRLSDVRVNSYGPNIYITCKLLDGPNILFAYDAEPNEIFPLDSPTTVSKSDNVNDCARSCSTRPDCYFFSYCSDRGCMLYTSPEASSSTIGPSMSTVMNNKCNVYKARLLHPNDINDGTVAHLDQFTSSSLILQRIKSMVNDRQLTLPLIGTADNMFVVSSPFELGGYGDVYKYDESTTSKLSDYKLLLSGSYLISREPNHQLTGLSYLDCLYYCENDDNCLTVSYCTDASGQCTISSYSEVTITGDPQNHTKYKSTCKVMSKTFLDFFNRLPGKRLIGNDQNGSYGFRKLTLSDRETCAKSCLREPSFSCEAFDYCPSEDEKSFECFLHKFHIFENSVQIFNTWDTSESHQCDHYKRKLSLDYKQFVGMKFIDGPFIVTINGNSLENCASACNQADEGCNSFEFCESQGTIDMSSCRLSVNPVIGNISGLVNAPTCSIYGIARNDKRPQVNYVVIKKGSSNHLAFACGLTAFVIGIIIAASITNYSLKMKK